MKELNITILVDLNTVYHKAYLRYMKEAGYCPSSIIVLDFPSKNRYAKKLSLVFGFRAANKLVRAYRYLKALFTNNILFKNLVKEIDLSFDTQVNFYEKFRYKDFCSTVDYVNAISFIDPILLGAIRASKAGLVLYTGGGIIPKQFFDLIPCKVLHIHPGIVPAIKGADCFFWSLLLNGSHGYSAFFMNAGVDTGDIVLQRTYPKHDFVFQSGIPAKVAYWACLYAIDSHLRARVLIDVIEVACAANLGIENLPGQPQQAKAGRYFSFLHCKLREKLVFDKFYI